MQVVTASGNTAHVWDVNSGKELVCFSGHESTVTSAAFSSDGTRVVTTSVDGTARVWDLISGQELQRFIGHEHALLSWGTFSPDGTRVVTASYDGTARIWRALTCEALVVFARTRVFRELTPEERREYGLG
jgi:WD40 repeat protein